MIIYFADRQFNILGLASTELPGGLTVEDDDKIGDVETGVAVFECKVPFNAATRKQVEEYTEVGNYLLRSHDGETEVYTIIDAEINTKKQIVYIYAEDAGMDLINEVVGEYAADKAYPISHYINMWAGGAGFQIGINEVANLTRKLSWDGEATVTERLASVATQFDGCEISYTFDVHGLEVTAKYINIFKERGKDNGLQLRLNQDIDSIVVTKTIGNLATALQCTGATPDSVTDEETGELIDQPPITLAGYSYDDGDFYVDGTVLKSREAFERWRRFLTKDGSTTTSGGHITKQFSYDTLEQSTLCAAAITELKKVRDMEVNYEVELSHFPSGIKLGDRVNIIDDAGELYLSSRILQLEVSVANQEQKLTLGEFLIKGSGISERVAALAAQFAAQSASATRALEIGNAAKAIASDAQAQADSALGEVVAVQIVVKEAQQAAASATETASAAQEAATNAESAVAAVEADVAALESTVADAQAAAEQAQQAAATADAKAVEAQQAAVNAQTQAEGAATAAATAQETADSALEKSETAQSTAEQAIADAEAAATTAAAAKLDAEQAQADIDALSEDLTTLESTMQADYARKTELTEATASLQTQITQNAAEISSTASKVQEIDETANNAATQAAAAQTAASTAQTQADEAAAAAEAAQTAADEAEAAATAAQAEADAAKTAAANAQSVADKAEADLETAKADLATVTSRVDATEEEIATAKAAVNTAQAAADAAKADAQTATEKATTAQTTADTAVSAATAAQATADDAASQAALAQKAADEAKGNATAAQTAADEAQATATEAQRTADEAATNAANAQATADQAAADAATAQAAANAADAKAAQAAADLATAEQNLSEVTSRVDATEEEVAAAQAAVTTAQAAADKAKEDAEAAQATADTAKANAATAQTTADNAKTAADNAQDAADAAQKAADEAQAAVDALAVRVTTAETKITQNSEQIALMATKTEVTETLGGYSTKEETEAAIKLESETITHLVSKTYATKQEVEAIEIGGRNLLQGTATPVTTTSPDDYDYQYLTYVPTVLPLEDGHPYTISADVEILAGDIGGISVKLFDAALQTQYAEVIPYIIDGHIEGTFDSVNGAAERVLLYAGVAGSTAGNSVTFSNIKFEKGNKATDWTPAPEDIDDSIAEAQTTADNASESATSANERITTAESLIQQLSNSIAMLVVDENGESLMTQTEDGWSFSMAETAEAVSSLTSSLEALQQETGSTQATVDILQQAVSDHGKTLEYVNVTTYEDEPCIELGESDSDFKLLITNTRIMFMNGSNVPTYINTNGLVTQNIEVKGEIVQGGYVMLNTSDGGWGLLWKGVNS